MFGVAYLVYMLYTLGMTTKGNNMNTTTHRFQAVNIKRLAKGHYTVNNTKGITISFKRLSDAQTFIICNWSKELIEAQHAA